MNDIERKQLAQTARDVAEIKRTLQALVRPRSSDKADHDAQAIDLGDVLTKIETDR